MLKITSKFGKGRGSHYHLLYLNEDTGVGRCTVDNKHFHDVEFDPETGGWRILPAPDGHTHEIQDYEAGPGFTDDRPDVEIVREVYSLFKEGLEYEDDSYKKAKESHDFYDGEQWTHRQKTYLENLDRACLTINLCAHEIDSLSGYQREQRTDLKFLPQEQGDAIDADLCTVLTKMILTRSVFEREESEGCKDQYIGGRGLYNLFMDYDFDMRGEIKIEKFPWDGAFFGPHDKLDGSDAEYVVKHKMYSMNKIEQLWPDKADAIHKDYEITLLMSDPDKITQHSDDQYAHDTNQYHVTPMVMGDLTMFSKLRREYRVLELWKRIYVDSAVIAFPDDGFYQRVIGWKSKDLTAIEKTIPGALVVKRSIPKMAISRVAGGVLLSHNAPADLPSDEFHLIPLYAHKRKEKYYGLIERIKDPQREINKRHSQAIDIGNKVANYGYYIDDTTFEDSGDERDFIDNVTSPGAVHKVAQLERIPVKEEGAKFPSEIVSLMQLDVDLLNKLMNTSLEPGGANESGAHLLHRQRLTMAGKTYLFDNLSFAKQAIGKRIIAMVQKYYSAERVYRMVSNQHQKTPITLGDQPFDQFTMEDIQFFLDNADLTKLDVVVSETEHAPSSRLMAYMLVQNMAQAGAPVPPEVLIELSPVSQEQKEKILTSIEQQRAMEAEQGQTESNAEINKTLIAQGIIPPEVQERLEGAQRIPDQNGTDASQNFRNDRQIPQDLLT